MKKHLFTVSLLSVLLLATGCKQAEEKTRHIPTAPQMEARIDRSEPVKIVDVEQASGKPAPLKLSQIASEIEYYTVGDARFTVTQAIDIQQPAYLLPETRYSEQTIRVQGIGL